jgi:hypothetical protein
VKESLYCRWSRTCGYLLCRALAASLSALFAIGAWAEELSVPYVPTPQEVVERMLQMAKVGPGDYVIDLGSGDGRIVVTAARKHGARGFGVDLNPARIIEANENARNAGVADKVAFYQRDLFETDLSQATVITMYLLPRVNLELRPKLLELKPGTRIVSHDFSMNDWTPDVKVTMDIKDKYGAIGGDSDVYFWVVPAKTAGRWQWQLKVSGKTQRYEVVLEQKFQMISGTARVGGRSVRLQNARLRGDQISFSFTVDINGAALKHDFSGRVEADGISGNVALTGSSMQGRLDWNAARGAANTGARTHPISTFFLVQSIQ